MTCRACALSADNLHPLTGEWAIVYTFCTSVELVEDESLPRTVCRPCRDQLSEFYRFKNRCIASNLALLEAHSGSFVKSENDFDRYSDDFRCDASLDGNEVKFDPSDFLDTGCASQSRKKSRSHKKLNLSEPTVKTEDVKEDIKIDIDDRCPLDSGKKRGPKKKKKKVYVKKERKDTVKPIRCKKKNCNRSYSSQAKYEIHILKVHKGVNVELECHQCKIGKKFESYEKLRLHEGYNHFEKECVCPTCNKSFNSSLALVAHERLHSRKPRRFMCDVCGTSLASKESLQRHQETHAPHRERRYGCEACGKAYHRSSQLYRHLRSAHGAARPHACAACGKAFADRQGLRKHAVVHMAVKPFACAVCHKRYSTAWFLRQHARTHSGERPFACAHCAMAFTSKQYLVWHARSHARQPLDRRGGNKASSTTTTLADDAVEVEGRR